MNFALLASHAAQTDIATEWISLAKNANILPMRFTISSHWAELTGTLDGTLQILATADPDKTDYVILKEYTLDEAALSEVLVSEAPFAYIKLNYVGGSITAGTLSSYVAIAYGVRNG